MSAITRVAGSGLLASIGYRHKTSSFACSITPRIDTRHRLAGSIVRVAYLISDAECCRNRCSAGTRPQGTVQPVADEAQRWAPNCVSRTDTSAPIPRRTEVDLQS